MRFATPTAAYYCGIDLHARTLYLVVKDGPNLRRQHASGNFGTTVTPRRGRGRYFLLTAKTL